jgi:hypothetical protein
MVMALPPLVTYATEVEYRGHFEREYCRATVATHDGIRVFFGKGQFDHAFFESTNRDGLKNAFSTARAERIDWIKATLLDPNADRYQGWDARARQYQPTRRVEVVYEDFVVVLQLGRKLNGDLKAQFVTCFKADNSIGKIRTSPLWTLQDRLNAL